MNKYFQIIIIVSIIICLEPKYQKTSHYFYNIIRKQCMCNNIK